MGDRYEKKRLHRRFGLTIPPEPIMTWGMGHNGGPEFDEEPPGYLWRRHCWTKAHREVWKNPGMGVLKFRVARAEAAGVSYREYMLHLLDTGRYLQREDVERATAADGPAPPAEPTRKR